MPPAPLSTIPTAVRGKCWRRGRAFLRPHRGVTVLVSPVRSPSRARPASDHCRSNRPPPDGPDGGGPGGRSPRGGECRPPFREDRRHDRSVPEPGTRPDRGRTGDGENPHGGPAAGGNEPARVARARETGLPVDTGVPPLRRGRGGTLGPPGPIRGGRRGDGRPRGDCRGAGPGTRREAVVRPPPTAGTDEPAGD